MGWLSPNAAAMNESNLDAYRQAMRGLGYVEGRMVITVYRFADGGVDHLADLAGELVNAGDAGGRGPVADHTAGIGVRNLDELESALAGFSAQRPDVVVVTAEPFTNRHRERIIAFLVQQRIPAMFEDRTFVDAGGLMSYGPSVRDNFRQAAIYVDKILKGAKPADLPVAQPTKFELVINLKTANALGITIPQSLLLRADEVIE